MICFSIPITYPLSNVFIIKGKMDVNHCWSSNNSALGMGTFANILWRQKHISKSSWQLFWKKKQLLSSTTILYNPDLIIFCISNFFSIYFQIYPNNTLFSTVLTLKCSQVSVIVMPKKRQEYNCNFLWPVSIQFLSTNVTKMVKTYFR